MKVALNVSVVSVPIFSMRPFFIFLALFSGISRPVFLSM